jgi:hypothetical protein
MATAIVEKQLLELERQYWQAIKDKDVDAAMRLTDDPCIVAGAQGIGRIDHKRIEAMMRAATYELVEFEVKDDVLVHMLRDDVAILAYKVRENLKVEGKPITLEAADSSIWVRKGGHWRCALHTESLSGDPFGRDRQRS